jgi:hypothetical protein
MRGSAPHKRKERDHVTIVVSLKTEELLRSATESLGGMMPETKQKTPTKSANTKRKQQAAYQDPNLIAPQTYSVSSSQSAPIAPARPKDSATAPSTMKGVRVLPD